MYRQGTKKYKKIHQRSNFKLIENIHILPCKRKFNCTDLGTGRNVRVTENLIVHLGTGRNVRVTENLIVQT